jgi:hypothetical protein
VIYDYKLNLGMINAVEDRVVVVDVGE